MSDSLRPSQIRERIRAEHEQIRELLRDVDAAAVGVLAGHTPPAANLLRQLFAALHVALSAHLDLEDAVLAPALRETDAFGPDRAEEMLTHHAEQRQILDRALEEARAPGTDTGVLARHARQLIQYLMQDMAVEDRDLLNPSLLKDDLVNVGITS